MATVSVRYIVNDVDAAIAFYCTHLGFTEVMHPAPSFAMLARGDLRLVLSAPGGGPGGGAAMPDGTLPEPGGWNRFSVQVDDLEATAAQLREAGAQFRNDIVTGIGGKQVLVEDPSGNPVELFEPTRDEARLGSATPKTPTYEVKPIGRVESSLTDRALAPMQGTEGAPDAWLLFDENVADALADLTPGSEVLVLTWLYEARRDTLRTHPRDDQTQPVRGVFSTRSPDRPNPVGLHRVPILEVDGLRIKVAHMEAIDGTPLVDVKPVLHP